MMSRKPASKVKFPLGPVRTCVLCRAKALKTELVRIPRPAGAGPALPGRGVYVCAGHDAAQIVKNRKKLAKALRCDVEALHFN